MKNYNKIIELRKGLTKKEWLNYTQSIIDIPMAPPPRILDEGISFDIPIKNYIKNWNKI